MNPHYRASAALVAILAGVCPRPAWAGEVACPAMTVEADVGFRARYSELLERIQSEFASRVDVDTCARVELRAEGDTVITMAVTLPDGRAASRSVTRRDDVVPALQALLLVPDRPDSLLESPAAPASRSTTQATLRYAPRLHQPSRRARDTPVRANAAARGLGIELSVITGARVGDGQVGYGVGALSFLEVHGWLFGFEGRADSYRSLQGGDPETALELAALTGWRFNLGDVALDLTAGPAVALKGLAVSHTEVTQVSESGMSPPPPPPPPRSDPSSGPVPRLLLGARLGFFPRSTVRTFVGIDGEVGPARVADDAGPSSARLPAFSLGLAFGGTVGTP